MNACFCQFKDVTLLKINKNMAKINYLSLPMLHISRVIEDLSCVCGFEGVGRYNAIAYHLANLEIDNFRLNIRKKTSLLLLQKKLQFKSNEGLLEFIEILVELNFARYEYELGGVVYSDMIDVEGVESKSVYFYIPEVRAFYYERILPKSERGKKGAAARHAKKGSNPTKKTSNERSKVSSDTKGNQIENEARELLRLVISDESEKLDSISADVSNEAKSDAVIRSVIDNYKKKGVESEQHALNIINKAIKDKIADIRLDISKDKKNAKARLETKLKAIDAEIKQSNTLVNGKKLEFIAQKSAVWTEKIADCEALREKYNLAISENQKKYIESMPLFIKKNKIEYAKNQSKERLPKA